MIGGLVIQRTGRYLELIWVGLGLLALGFGLLIKLDACSSIGETIVFQIIAGFGAGLLFQPPLIALQAQISQDDTATATATFGFVRELALCFAIVIGGVVLQNGMDLRQPELRAAGIPVNITQQFSGKTAIANVMLLQTLENPSRKAAVKEAFAWILRNLWILQTCVAMCGIVASAFVGKYALKTEHSETTTGLKGGVAQGLEV